MNSRSIFSGFRASPRPSAGARAFTLTELLIAIGLFTFGAIGILALFTSAMSAHRAAVDRSVSALAAENIVGFYRHAFVEGVDPRRDKDWSMNAPEPPPGYRCQVAFEPDADSVNSVTGVYDAYVMQIDISWGPENRPRFERFRTVIVRQGDLGN
jgi:hypothetical protein